MLGENPTHDALVASALNFVADLEGIRAVDHQGLTLHVFVPKGHDELLRPILTDAGLDPEMRRSPFMRSASLTTDLVLAMVMVN